MTVITQLTNSENEEIFIEQLPAPGPFKDQYLLIIKDDLPPKGAGTRALHLLDKATRDWLLEELPKLDI